MNKRENENTKRKIQDNSNLREPYVIRSGNKTPEIIDRAELTGEPELRTDVIFRVNPEVIQKLTSSKEDNVFRESIPKLSTKSIMGALSEEWQPITVLILKLNLKVMYDVRYLQLKLKELERKGLVFVKTKMGKKHWKLAKTVEVDWDKRDLEKFSNREQVKEDKAGEMPDISGTALEDTKILNELISGYLVFISYATKDSKEFNIPLLSNVLSKFPEIGKVLYWEEDVDDNIIEYMNKYVKECDIFILICSQNALISEPVKMEWQAALMIKKKIIPVFKNEEDIPVLLTTRLGIKYDENNLTKTINDLYDLILRKLS